MGHKEKLVSDGPIIHKDSAMACGGKDRLQIRLKLLI